MDYPTDSSAGSVAAPSDSDLLTLRQIASLWGVSLPALAGRRNAHREEFDQGSVSGGRNEAKRWPRARVAELRADPRFSRPPRKRRRRDEGAELDRLDALALAARGEEAPDGEPRTRQAYEVAADPSRPVRISVPLVLTLAERAALTGYREIYGVSAQELIRGLIVRRLRKAGFLPELAKVPDLADASDGEG